MAEASVNGPLLLRTVQALRERFAALRSAGRVFAVMQESPRGGETPKDPKPKDSGLEIPPFDTWEKSTLRWRGGSIVERGDRRDKDRAVNGTTATW